MAIQPAQSYRVVVHLLRQDGTELHSYPTEARHWQNVVLDVMSWLRIEVLPYWRPGDLALVWDEDGMDMRLSGALYGMALSHALVPPWWTPPPAPAGWEPHPEHAHRPMQPMRRSEPEAGPEL